MTLKLVIFVVDALSSSTCHSIKQILWIYYQSGNIFEQQIMHREREMYKQILILLFSLPVSELSLYADYKILFIAKTRLHTCIKIFLPKCMIDLEYSFIYTYVWSLWSVRY